MIFEALSLHVIVAKHQKISFFNSINIAFSSNFYNGITPFASGGQPFQIYYYNKVGIKPEDSTSALVVQFIVHQACLCLFALVAMISYFSFLTKEIENIPIGFLTINFPTMVCIGFMINLSILILLILMTVSTKFKRLAWHIIDLFKHVKFLKNRIDKVHKKVEEFILEFQHGCKVIGKDLVLLSLTFAYKFFSLLLFFAIPFFIFDALGVTILPSQMYFIICMSIFSFVLMSWMPTPGASGAAEWAFTTVFVLVQGTVISPAIAIAGTLLWRFTTYYLKMFFGFISVIILNRIKRGVIDEDRIIHG